MLAAGACLPFAELSAGADVFVGLSARWRTASGRMLKWPEAMHTSIVRKTGLWART